MSRSLDHWDINIGLAYLDAKFTRFISVDENHPDNDPDQSGNPLPRAPEFSASASVAYTMPMGGAGSLTLHGGYKYQSRIFFTPYEDVAASQSGYGLWDASLRFDSPARRWYVALYGTNLADELYAHWGGRGPYRGVSRGWGAPRTVGLMAGIRFAP
jgi:iron complex outermembrane receptor protein